MIQSFVTPVLKRISINTQPVAIRLGVFLQYSSTLDLVSRRHIRHNYFIPVLYKQKESVTQSILIQFLVATLHNHANPTQSPKLSTHCTVNGTKEISLYLLAYSFHYTSYFWLFPYFTYFCGMTFLPSI